MTGRNRFSHHISRLSPSYVRISDSASSETRAVFCSHRLRPLPGSPFPCVHVRDVPSWEKVAGTGGRDRVFIFHFHDVSFYRDDPGELGNRCRALHLSPVPLPPWWRLRVVVRIGALSQLGRSLEYFRRANSCSLLRRARPESEKSLSTSSSTVCGSAVHSRRSALRAG